MDWWFGFTELRFEDLRLEEWFLSRTKARRHEGVFFRQNGWNGRNGFGGQEDGRMEGIGGWAGASQPAVSIKRGCHR